MHKDDTFLAMEMNLFQISSLLAIALIYLVCYGVYLQGKHWKKSCLLGKKDLTQILALLWVSNNVETHKG